MNKQYWQARVFLIRLTHCLGIIAGGIGGWYSPNREAAMAWYALAIYAVANIADFEYYRWHSHAGIRRLDAFAKKLGADRSQDMLE